MEEIEDAARKANAHDFIVLLPDGYDTVVGEYDTQLSTGMCSHYFVWPIGYSYMLLYKVSNLLKTVSLLTCTDYHAHL